MCVSFRFKYELGIPFLLALCSMGTKIHIHVSIGCPPVVVWRCKYLDRVLNAAQQDRVRNPTQQLASLNPKLPIPPTPSL